MDHVGLVAAFVSLGSVMSAAGLLLSYWVYEFLKELRS
jgi:hypothetical protein